VVAVGLICSALLGLWLAFKYARSTRTILVLTALGTVIPIILLLI
jgi:hypothetical protein